MAFNEFDNGGRAPILDHPRWGEFKKWLRVTVGTQGQWHIDFIPNIPASLKKEMREVRLICHCGNYYNPIRSQAGTDNVHIWATGARDNGHRRCSYPAICRTWVLSMVTSILPAKAFDEAIKEIKDIRNPTQLNQISDSSTVN